MPTLTATSAMRQALTKAAIPAPRHAVHKSPIGAPRDKSPPERVAQKATVIEERAATRDPAGVERRNALVLRLRALYPPCSRRPPMSRCRWRSASMRRSSRPSAPSRAMLP
jgi:hypothetical protein